MPIDQRRRDDIAAAVAAAGFNRKNLIAPLRRLVAAGFLSRTQGSGIMPDTYRLRLPPVRR
jgi:hypothetical protein